MKRILSTFAQKWPEYLLEVLVLIVGIYGAFMLDNWNENRLSRVEEQEILRNLKTDFEGTIREFEALNKLRETLFASNEIIDFYSTQKGLNYDSLPLDSICGNLLYIPTFNSKGSALEAVTNSGKISLIQNDEIRNLLISWPGLIADMQEGEQNDTYLAYEQMMPVMIKHVSLADIMAQMVRPVTLFKNKPNGRPENIKQFESDYSTLLKDKTFINVLDLRILTNMFAYDETNELIEDGKIIVNMINQELK